MNPLTRIEMVVHLQAVDLFNHCTAEQTVRIAGIARQRHADAGQVLYAVNQPADALYCVVAGEVVLRDGAGNERVVESPGTFGVEEILSDRLRFEQATARCDDTALLVLDAEDFFDLLSNNIEIVKALFRQLLRRPRRPPAADGTPAEGTARQTKD